MPVGTTGPLSDEGRQVEPLQVSPKKDRRQGRRDSACVGSGERSASAGRPDRPGDPCGGATRRAAALADRAGALCLDGISAPAGGGLSSPSYTPNDPKGSMILR